MLEVVFACQAGAVIACSKVHQLNQVVHGGGWRGRQGWNSGAERTRANLSAGYSLDVCAPCP
eukprot:4631828-Amphidinium_carterae.1